MKNLYVITWNWDECDWTTHGVYNDIVVAIRSALDLIKEVKPDSIFIDRFKLNKAASQSDVLQYSYGSWEWFDEDEKYE